METHWFYTVWPFIGVGGALVMLAILLLTDTFRGSTAGSRFRDPMWLAWLAVPFYWLHQFEEYSLPVLGIHYSIQEMICEKIGFPPYPCHQRPPGDPDPPDPPVTSDPAGGAGSEYAIADIERWAQVGLCARSARTGTATPR